MFNKIPSRFERQPQRLFVVPHCRYEIWAAAVGALAATAATAYTVSGAGQPGEPNLSSSTAALSNAEASMLPYERQLAAEAQNGGTSLNFGYTTQPDSSTVRTKLQTQLQALQAQQAQLAKAAQGAPGKFNASSNTSALNGQIASLQTQIAALPASGPVYFNNKGQVVPQSQAVTDFGAFGGNQTQAAIAKQNAGDQLQLEQQYDPAFIQSALTEEQLADPESVAARGEESNLIQQQINQPITNPVASTLENQVGSQVSAGKGLDDFDSGVLNNAVGQALGARGGSSTPGDFTSPVTTGLAGDQRQLAGIQGAQNFLGSGTTPEDVQYRQQQQDLANLSAEVSGQTPTSEFGSLSNASRGPNPVSQGAPLPTLPGNLMQTAGNAALTTQQQQAGQANNWLGGLSTVLNAGGAISQITGKPA